MKPVGALAVKRRLAPDELYYSMGRKQGERQERILLCGRNGRQRREEKNSGGSGKPEMWVEVRSGTIRTVQ